MYTYKEKKKAVDLFIKYDLSPAAVIHELGYPSKTSYTSGIRNTYRQVHCRIRTTEKENIQKNRGKLL